MSIVVYWITKPSGEGMFPGFSEPKCRTFKATELVAALAFCQDQRTAGMRHVSLSSENADSVGEPGVNSIVDGKTPDGHDYEWSKQHRGAGPRKAE